MNKFLMIAGLITSPILVPAILMVLGNVVGSLRGASING